MRRMVKELRVICLHDKKLKLNRQSKEVISNDGKHQ